MSLRDRVIEFRRVPVGDLAPHPKNWRKHPRHQQNALRGLLDEVGFAGAALARRADDGKLVLIDGHLRREMLPGEEIPVLVTDLSEAEADKLLATYDPIGALATRLHNFRRLVTRLERKARNVLALLKLACAIILLPHL